MVHAIPRFHASTMLLLLLLTVIVIYSVQTGVVPRCNRCARTGRAFGTTKVVSRVRQLLVVRVTTAGSRATMGVVVVVVGMHMMVRGAS